ncbi:tautomerase family protein [Rodentibacter myodis]|uniref:4-oxalocrotonate tautomerase n=1 Tax=Rodentibacter myodis TaxID=1907939 RepID=A0A1V3JI83_9PAST|nr:tautomerase family protein [Rodentibacter myodis]OOF56344.1 4-oxalocrotonate tautomerase [Rodentibacter myodis]
MPHINIKCYPKGLTEQELQAFADDLTAFASERLNTPAEYITIDYTEIPAEEWKEKVYDAEIKPNAAHLLRKPEYEM